MSANQQPGTQRRLTLTVALLTMIGPFTVDTYLPSFPDIEAQLGISRALLTQSLGFYLGAFALSTLFWGPLSDRVGRRRVILATLGLYVASSIGCGLADDYSTFMIARVLQGVSASGGMVAGRAMIRDTHDTRAAQRAMSQVMLLFAVAPAIAPIIGGWLHDAFGWRSVFTFLALFATAIGVLVWRVTGETLDPAHRQSFRPAAVLKVYARTLTNLRFIALVLTVAGSFGGLFLYIAGAPTIIYDVLGLSSQDFGIQFVPMVAGLMLGSYFSQRNALAGTPAGAVRFSLGVLTLAVAANLAQALWLPANPWTVIAPLVIYAFGIAYIIPAITVLALDCFPKNRGSASAVQAFLQMSTNALLTSLVVPLLTGNILWFALGQLLLFIIAGTVWRVANRVHSAPEDGETDVVD